MLKRNDLALGLKVLVILLFVMAVFSNFVASEEGGSVTNNEEAIDGQNEENNNGDEEYEGGYVGGVEEIVNFDGSESDEQNEEVEGENGGVKQNVIEEDKNEDESVDENLNSLDEEVTVGEGDEQFGEVEDDYEYIELEEISLMELEIEEIEEDEVSDYELIDIDEIVVEHVEEESVEVKYVFESGGEKEFETFMDKSDPIEIDKDEEVIEKNGEWIKKVSLNSLEHHENEVIVYEDIIPSKKHEIYLYWEQEEKFIDFKTYDEDKDGLVDRISWVVPHLSLQEFEIIITLNENEDVNQTDIDIIPISVPEGVLDEVEVGFEFDVIYSNVNNVVCNFSLFDSDGIVKVDNFIEGGTIELDTIGLENGVYDWIFRCYDFLNESMEDIETGEFTIEVDYTPVIEFNSDVSSIDEGQSVLFTVNVSTITNSEIGYTLRFGDGNEETGSFLDSRSVYFQRSHSYSDDGSFTGELEVLVDGVSYVNSLQISVNNINEVDEQDPEITLIDPDDDDFISSDIILFSYRVNDNVFVDNCTFSLYYYNDSVLGELVYESFKDDIVLDERVDIDLENFDEGDYSWDVECYDNSSNKEIVTRDFTYIIELLDDTSDDNAEVEVLTSSSSDDGGEESGYSEDIDRINVLIDSINNFLIAEEKYSSEEREVIEDLGIIENIKFHKKRLLQMELDLEHNIDYIIGEDKRDERVAEILNEIEGMEEDIPESLRVVESSEYFKNSLDVDFERIVRSYAETKGLVLNDRAIKRMADQTKQLQNSITVSVKARHIEIGYANSEEELTVITKEIKIKEGNFDAFLEIFPEDLVTDTSKVSFIAESVTFNDDPIFEVMKEDVGEKIVYTIEGFVALNSIEGTSTLAFKEEVPLDEIGGVTGLVTFVGGGDNGVMFYLSWVIAIFVLAFVVIYTSGKMKIKKLRKNQDFNEIFVISGEIEESLRQKDVDSARERYIEAQGLYQNIPDNGKGIAYRKLEKLHRKIDVKDMAALIREFLSVAKEGRTEDALMIYGNIQPLYSRMPVRLQKKVFEKVNPVVRRIQRTGKV